jgi:hypothetical protein
VFPSIWGGLKLEAGLGSTATKVGLTVEAETTIRFNSTGQDRVIQLNLPGAPSPESLDLKARTFAIGGSGRIGIADTLTITGSFALEIGPAQASLALDGRTELAIGEMTVVGRLTWVYGEGLFGVLSAAALVDAPGFRLQGTFQVELNTTSTTRGIPLLVVDQTGLVTGTRQGMIESKALRIAFGGTLTIAGFVDLQGSARIVLNGDVASLSLSMNLDLKSFGRTRVTTEAVIRKEADGLRTFAMRSKVDLHLRLGDGIQITGRGDIQINTSRSTEYLGVAVATTVIDMSGELKVLGIRGQMSGRFVSENGAFVLEFQSGLNFFSVVKIEVQGRVSSDGTFRIAGSAQVEFSIEIAKLTGTLTLEVTHNSLTMRVGGGLYVRNPFISKGGKSWVSLSGVTGAVQLYETGAHLDLTVKVLGMDVPLRFAWGTPPPPSVLGMPRFTADLGDSATAGEGKALVDPLVGPHHGVATTSSFAITSPLGQSDPHQRSGLGHWQSTVQRGRHHRDDTSREVLHREFILETDDGDGTAGVALAGAASEELAIDAR